jgi:RimJ/RimL family protein N-acetyltransferase
VIDLKNYRAVEKLKDDTPVIVRAIRLDDRERVIAAFKGLDPDSIYTRFFTYKNRLTDAELEQTTNVDFDRVVALVVTTPASDGEKLIGGGRFAMGDGPIVYRSAELAFLTSDQYRGRGMAGLILRHLAVIGRELGVLQFEALVLAQNKAMLSVFRGSGLPMTIRPEGAVMNVTLSLDANRSC